MSADDALGMGRSKRLREHANPRSGSRQAALDARAADNGFSQGFGVLQPNRLVEHYQQTICVLHALERGELLPFCDCTDRSRWAQFNYTIKLHRPTRQSDNRSDDGHDALIDELTRLDRKVYAAAVHRLRRDASRVERVHGVRLWCND